MPISTIQPGNFNRACLNVVTGKAFIKGDGSEASQSDPVDTVCLSDVNGDQKVDWRDAFQPSKWMPKLSPRQEQEREKFLKAERWKKLGDDLIAEQGYKEAREFLGYR